MSNIETLLSRDNAPCDKLSMKRIQLDASMPFARLFNNEREGVLYSLVGQAQAYVDGVRVGIIGGRKSVTEQQAHAIRVPWGVRSEVCLTLDGFSADFLWVTRQADHAEPATSLPYVHRNDTFFHEVGSGAHRRTVGEVPTPQGFMIFLGETLNIPGGTSSWPAHATPEDVEAFARGETTWEEMMFFVAPKPGIAVLNGFYSNMEVAYKSISVENGSAHIMPLGSHRITAAPDSFIYYFWAYTGSALKKTYNRFATDVLTYVK
jgi:5-deoxy-D-glucuronate isomerase